MKLKRTSIALALASGLLLSGTTFANEPVIMTYEVYQPVVQPSGWVIAPAESSRTVTTYYYYEPAPQVIVQPAPTYTYYYLVPGTRDSQMPNPRPPSESRAWGG